MTYLRELFEGWWKRRSSVKDCSVVLGSRKSWKGIQDRNIVKSVFDSPVQVKGKEVGKLFQSEDKSENCPWVKKAAGVDIEISEVSSQNKN